MRAYDFRPEDEKVYRIDGLISEANSNEANEEENYVYDWSQPNATPVYDRKIQDAIVSTTASRWAIPASNWAKFTFTSSLTQQNVSEAYTRILTEWFPASGYTRNEKLPNIETIPVGSDRENRPWEIWIPLLKCD